MNVLQIPDQSTHLLAQYHRSSTRQATPRAPRREAPDAAWPFPLCPTRGHLLFRNPHTGRLQPKMCGTLRCPTCIAPVAFRYGAAIALAHPEHALLLTHVGEEWPAIRVRINRFRAALRRLGPRLYDVYHVEENPGGGGNHAHLWAWGDAPDSESIARAARSAKLGAFTALQEAYVPTSGRLTYGMKAVLDHPGSGDRLSPQAERFLDLNGGRLLHASRGFWRDGVSGEQYAGVRAAATAATRQLVSGRYIGLAA